MSEPTQPHETPQASSGTSPADADHDQEQSHEQDNQGDPGIGDDQLPDDLKPTDDNPLAKPLDPDDEATKPREELEMDATQDDSHDGPGAAESQTGDTGDDAGDDAGTEND